MHVNPEETDGIASIPASDPATALIDLSAVSLATLEALEGTALAASLRRLYAEIEDAPTIVAGFESAL